MLEDALVEKHPSIHRLVLRRRSDVSVHGQVSQERFDLRFGGQEVFARAQTVEPDDPLHIRALSMNGVVVETECVTDFIEEFWLLTSRDVRHTGFRNSSLKRLIMGME